MYSVGLCKYMYLRRDAELGVAWPPSSHITRAFAPFLQMCDDLRPLCSMGGKTNLQKFC